MNAKMKEACLAVADVFEFAPECWTMDVLAEDGQGYAVEPCDRTAVSWCALGGVLAAINNDYDERVWRLLDPIAYGMGYGCASRANNEGGRLVAIKMLRMAGGQE